jgi:hypothetical protein
VNIRFRIVGLETIGYLANLLKNSHFCDIDSTVVTSLFLSSATRHIFFPPRLETLNPRWPDDPRTFPDARQLRRPGYYAAYDGNSSPEAGNGGRALAKNAPIPTLERPNTNLGWRGFTNIFGIDCFGGAI